MTAKAPQKSASKVTGRPRPRQQTTDPANDPSLALIPRLEQLPAELPQNGVTTAIHRSRLLPHPKNPQVMDPYAETGLSDSIRMTGGLVEDPIWNRRNGLLVGGHHRIEQEDKRRGWKDYWLSVKVVDWDEKTHLEAMVRLNNRNIQGQTDINLLDDLIKQGDFDPFAAGFDLPSLEDLYLENGLTFDLPGLSVEPADADGVSGEREIEESADDIANALDEADAARERQLSQQEIDEIKSRKADAKARARFENEKFVYDTIVWPTEAMRQAFKRYIHQPVDRNRIDGIGLVRFLELDIPELAAMLPEKTPDETGKEAKRNGKRTRSGTGDNRKSEQAAVDPRPVEAQAGDDPDRGEVGGGDAAGRFDDL
jgi:hypothetical protein